MKFDKKAANTENVLMIYRKTVVGVSLVHSVSFLYL